MAEKPEYLTTRELAALLRIKERKVYDLAASGRVACSRVTGKLLFPRAAIEAWLAAGTPGDTAAQRPAVMLGSHDPLLEWAIRQSRSGLAMMFDSSMDGLERFCRGEGIAAGLHVADDAGWNIEAVRTHPGTNGAVLTSWARRRRGILYRRDAGAAPRGLADLANRSVVPRQDEAGSQILLRRLLGQTGIAEDRIVWRAPARSEGDAALLVAQGKADATFGLAAEAAQHGLGFAPVAEEHYDLLVDRRAWFEPPFQTLIAFCRSDAFAARAREMAGYDVSALFAVRWNGPP